jgi:hypothetical protein
MQCATRGKKQTIVIWKMRYRDKVIIHFYSTRLLLRLCIQLYTMLLQTSQLAVPAIFSRSCQDTECTVTDVKDCIAADGRKQSANGMILTGPRNARALDAFSSACLGASSVHQGACPWRAAH